MRPASPALRIERVAQVDPPPPGPPTTMKKTEEPPLKPTIEPPGYVPPSHQGLDKLAWLMDRAIKIPGTPFTVGLDAILGLLPVGGDVLTGVVQAGLVLVALGHYQVPKAVASRMAANVLLDITLGSIPVVGDVFDMFFKANTRNMALLKQVQAHRAQHREIPSAPSIAWLIGLGALMFGTLALVLIGFVSVIAWLLHHPPF